MTPEEIASARLATQGVSDPRFARPEDVVRFLGAMQSQERALAKWSVAQRCRNASEADIDRALTDGAILRTHVLRPTWHYLAREDVRWILELTAPRVHALNAYYNRKLEIDAALVVRTQELIVGELEGGRHRTRKQLGEALERAGIEASGLRLGYIIGHAELDGLICSGAPAGKQHTYALLAERAPDAPRLQRDEALAALAERYFVGHGPATVKDFCWWSSLTVADAKRGIAMVQPKLERLEANGLTYWFHGHVAPPLARSTPGAPAAHLLQGYDEYVVGYSQSRGVIDLAGQAAGTDDGSTPFTHAVVLGTQVVGRWRRGPNRNQIVELQLARTLTRAERRALDEAIERYRRFLEAPAGLSQGR